MAQPRARKTPAPAPAPVAVKPDFNTAQHVVDSLLTKNAELTRQVAILEAAVAERDGFINANAGLLGLDVAMAQAGDSDV